MSALDDRIAALYPNQSEPQAGWLVWHIARVMYRETHDGASLSKLGGTNNVRQRFMAAADALACELDDLGALTDQ